MPKIDSFCTVRPVAQLFFLSDPFRGGPSSPEIQIHLSVSLLPIFVAPQFEPNTHSWKKPGTFTALRPSVRAHRRSRSCASGSSEPLSHYKYHKENWKQIFKWLSKAEPSTALPQVQALLFPKCFPPGLTLPILLCCVGRGTKSPAVPYQLGCSHTGSDELHVISQPSLSQLLWALPDPSSTTAAQELIKFKFLPSCRLLSSLRSAAISP